MIVNDRQPQYSAWEEAFIECHKHANICIFFFVPNCYLEFFFKYFFGFKTLIKLTYQKVRHHHLYHNQSFDSQCVFSESAQVEETSSKQSKVTKKKKKNEI